MRVLPLLLLAVSAAQAQFPAIFNILKAFGMTKQLECALPCILESANRVPCHEKGAAYTICANVDRIAKDVVPCTAKCNSGTANDFVVDLTKWVCGQSVPKSAAGAKEEASAAKAAGGAEGHKEL